MLQLPRAGCPSAAATPSQPAPPRGVQTFSELCSSEPFLELAFELPWGAQVKKGVEEIGLVGYRFNTIGVSDGISMGTDGMSFSLQVRPLRTLCVMCTLRKLRGLVRQARNCRAAAGRRQGGSGRARRAGWLATAG